MLQIAQANLAALRGKKYTGRGIVLGCGEDGSLLQVCWMTGRSPPSRNRVYVRDGGRIFTKTKDGSPMKDANIFYDAMVERGNLYIVGNGNQTTTMMEEMHGRMNFYEVMCGRRHEDDTYKTSRITGVWCVGQEAVPIAAICQLRKNPWRDLCDRHFSRFERIEPGFGYCVTTYQGDSIEPERFVGEPHLLPLSGSPIFVLQTLWDALNPDTRLGIAVKSIDPVKRTSKIVFKNA